MVHQLDEAAIAEPVRQVGPTLRQNVRVNIDSGQGRQPHAIRFRMAHDDLKQTNHTITPWVPDYSMTASGSPTR